MTPGENIVGAKLSQYKLFNICHDFQKHLNRAALVMLKEVQQSVRETEDLRANAQVISWPPVYWHLHRISKCHFFLCPTCFQR